MRDLQPRAWLCKHCGERVDPTMDLCWSCGYDRDGRAPEEKPTAVAAGLLDSCPSCQYDLRGNPEAIDCPECGQKFPHSALDYELYGVVTRGQPGTLTRFFRSPHRVLVVGLAAMSLCGVFLYLWKSVLIGGYRSSFALQVIALAELFVLASACFVLFGLFGLIVTGFQKPGDEPELMILYDRHMSIRQFFTSVIGRILIVACSVILILLFVLGHGVL